MARKLLARTVRKFADEQALWQREIASYATASGEGFVAMDEVYELQLARAWMLVAAANNAASAASDLCRGVYGSRENLEASQKRDLEKLKSALK
jgi:hypothetical protein